MFLIIDAAIRLICYLGFFIGLWFFVSPMVLPLIKKQIQLSRFKNDLRNSKNRKQESKFISHLRLIIYILFSTRSYFALFVFFLISFLLFAITFSTLFSRTYGIMYQTLLSLFMAALPYVLMRLKLRAIQVDGSYEAIELITKLTNQYKVNSKNMIIAIDKTIPELDNCPYSKKALFRLSMGVKEYRRPEDLKNLTYEFSYSLGTEWSKNLSTSLYFSINDGLDVSTSLDDYIEELKQISDSMEKAKRDNNEAFVLIKFVIPILYVFFLIMSVKTVGFTFEKFFNYQFKTAIGLRSGTIVFVSMIANYILYLLFKKPKYDF